MIEIILPDGTRRHYPKAQDAPDLTGLTIAKDLGPGLAKAALAIKFNGQMQDLSAPILHDGRVEIITRKSAEALELLRHDCAHLLAQAVQELFPGTNITFGPAIENGFYYDFYREAPFSSDDFAAIEARMHELVARDIPIEREEWSRAEAIDYFRAQGEHFKACHIESLPEDEVISIYRQGTWLDLCRGPHSPSTGRIGDAFKLMSIAGAYWKGDSRGVQLQRLYGTCWRDKKELRAWLELLEQARLRDHRKLGRELDLFHLQDEAQGCVFWHPKGWILYRLVEHYMRQRLDEANYQEVKTPQLVDQNLWERSGHWDKFREHMFIAEVDESEQTRMMALKPMNCPCHVQIFRQGIRSYRDLPLRMAEFGSCHRYEPSGALHGLMRVRAFTQDDAHIFCTPAQIISESKDFCDLLRVVYRDFGFEQVMVKFSDRPEKRAGSDAIWDKAEEALEHGAIASGLEFERNPGEGAFYGPKLEFVLRDAIGRDWQCGTLQVDFVLPERLDAHYIDAAGEKCRPVMLHRAILGSFERFIGILIEHYAGRLPLWLAPVQLVVASISEAGEAWVHEVCHAMQQAGLRVEADVRAEKIGYKIREHETGKIPVIGIIGKHECDDRTVTLRYGGGSGKPVQEKLTLAEAIEQISTKAQFPC